MSERSLFLFIFSLSSLLLFWFTLFLPVWEGFDEPAHFCYIQHLVEQKEIPTAPGRGTTDYCSTEVELTLQRLPLNQVLAHIPQLETFGFPLYQAYWQTHEDAVVADIPNDRVLRSTTTQMLDIWQGQHPPLPYAILSAAYIAGYDANFYVRFFLLRLFSIATVIFGLWVMWKALCRAIPEPLPRLIGFAAIALHPMFFIHFSRISNEPLTFVLFSSMWFLLVKALTTKQPRWQLWAMLGIVYGLGIISKVFFLSALPALLLVLGIDAVRTYRTAKKSARRAMMIKQAKGYGIAFVCIAIPAIPWFLYQQLGFVTPGVGFSQQKNLTTAMLIHEILYEPWLAYIVEVAKNFMGLFGWSFVRAPREYYWIHAILMAAVVYGITRLKGEHRRLVFAAALFPLAVFAGMAYYNLRFDYLAITGGWYFFSLGALLATMVGITAQTLIPAQFQRLALLLMIFFYTSTIVLVTYKQLIPLYYAL